MVHTLDKGLLKRDIQGLMGISIALNEENEREQLETLLKAIEAVHKTVVQHVNADKEIPVSPYPECDKWAKVFDKAKAIMQFCEEHELEYSEQNIYKFFGVDYWKCEEERRAMINNLG